MGNEEGIDMTAETAGGDFETKLERNPRPRLQAIDRRQMVLRPVDIEQLVTEDHEVRAIWELTGQLDLSFYYKGIKAVEGVAGREHVDPRLLISLWIYAYSEGISSAREISRLCEYHPAYQWLTGMKPINHHTLSDFRVDHKEALDGIFTEVLGLLGAEGLISLQRVMHDGTKIKAYAGADSFRRQERLAGSPADGAATCSRDGGSFFGGRDKSEGGSGPQASSEGKAAAAGTGVKGIG